MDTRLCRRVVQKQTGILRRSLERSVGFADGFVKKSHHSFSRGVMRFPYNLDYSKRLVIDTSKKAMKASALPGVERISLEREKLESGITTSVVRYEAGAVCSEHYHPGGEEIFVLEGEFGDECGLYPAGTYVRNPPGSHHSPLSKIGCKLFVKLNQFQEMDSERVVINTTKKEWLPGRGDLKVMPLAGFGAESTALVKWPEGAAFIPHTHFGGEEIFVLEGTFIDEKGEYPTGTWIRSPHLSNHDPFVKEGCTILVKTGHLLPLEPSKKIVRGPSNIADLSNIVEGF